MMMLLIQFVSLITPFALALGVIGYILKIGREHGEKKRQSS